MTTLGSRIRKLRINSGLSIGSLEKTIKLNNIHKYEVDSVRPGADAIITLSAFFNVSCDWLLLGDSYPKNTHINESIDKELYGATQLLQELYQNRGENVRNLALSIFQDSFSKFTK